MNAFTSIAAAKNTSLAVVAPGIAEALFATALGLVAAIHAVIGYNKLSNDIGRSAGRLEAFSGEFGAIMSRKLDEKGGAHGRDPDDSKRAPRQPRSHAEAPQDQRDQRAPLRWHETSVGKECVSTGRARW